MTENRERWGTRFAFIMAAVGSAVGLGNVWRFPFMAYDSGGGAFFVPYLVALLTAGIPVMILEYALGMKHQKGPPGAMAAISKKFRWVGWLAIGVGLSISFYYVVIMAYSWRYMVASVDREWEQPTSNQTVFKIPYVEVKDEKERDRLKKIARKEVERASKKGVGLGTAHHTATFLLPGEIDKVKKKCKEKWGDDTIFFDSADQVLTYAKEYYEKGHETRLDDVKARVWIVPAEVIEPKGEGVPFASFLDGYYSARIDDMGRDDPKAELRIPEVKKIRFITPDENAKVYRDDVILGGFEAGKWFRQGEKTQKIDGIIEEISDPDAHWTDLDEEQREAINGYSLESRRLLTEIETAHANDWVAPMPENTRKDLIKLLEGYREDNSGEAFSLDMTLVFWTAVTWLIIFLVIFKGVHVVGKVVMITVPLPIILLGILIIHGFTLDGAGQGINFLLSPKWELIMDMQVWFKAYGQVFFSLSLGFGILIAYASYMPQDSDVSNNAFMTAFCNCATSFYASFAVFSVLGYLAMGLNVPTGAMGGGPGLVFITYPVAISQMASDMGGFIAGTVGVFFFLSLLTLGIDSAFSIVEAVVTGVHDSVQKMPKATLAAIVCALGFVISVFPYCTRSGLIWLDINDNLANYGLIFVGLMECIVVGHFYRIEELRKFVNTNSEIKLHRWWDALIKYVTPGILIILFVRQMMLNAKEVYEGYDVFMEHSVTIWGWGYFAVLFMVAFAVGRNWHGLIGEILILVAAGILMACGISPGGSLLAGVTGMILFGGFYVCLRIAMKGKGPDTPDEEPPATQD